MLWRIPHSEACGSAVGFYENAAECPVLWTGMNAAVLKFDRQDILVLHCIFAEAGKPRLSVKPRLVGGELHSFSNFFFLKYYEDHQEI